MGIKSKCFHLMLFTNPNITPEYITVMLIGTQFLTYMIISKLMTSLLLGDNLKVNNGNYMFCDPYKNYSMTKRIGNCGPNGNFLMYIYSLVAQKIWATR